MRMIAAGLVLSQIFCATAVFAQSSGGAGGGSGAGGAGGAGSSPGAASGGSLGSSAGAPGTNSLGTAVPSGSGRAGYGATGTTTPEIDRQDKELDRKIKSICKGC